MLTTSQLDVTVNEIKSNFYCLIKHPYLESYIADPEVDEDKIRFLYAMLQEQLPDKEIEMFTISTLLVQAALDIHEAVTLNNLSAEISRKKGQLEILAGDYYSSLYYYLLAENEHLSMIQVFSHTIQDINEYKMNIYGPHDLTFKEVEENVSLIESILIQKIAERFSQSHWTKVLSDYFYLKRLFLEKQQWQEGKKPPIVLSLQQSIEADQDIDFIAQIDSLIEGVKDRLLEGVKALGSFEGFVIELIDNMIERATIQSKIGEER